jgi:hypothetical protein
MKNEPHWSGDQWGDMSPAAGIGWAVQRGALVFALAVIVWLSHRLA